MQYFTRFSGFDKHFCASEAENFPARAAYYLLCGLTKT